MARPKAVRRSPAPSAPRPVRGLKVSAAARGALAALHVVRDKAPARWSREVALIAAKRIGVAKTVAELAEQLRRAWTLIEGEQTSGEWDLPSPNQALVRVRALTSAFRALLVDAEGTALAARVRAALEEWSLTRDLYDSGDLASYIQRCQLDTGSVLAGWESRYTALAREVRAARPSDAPPAESPPAIESPPSLVDRVTEAAESVAAPVSGLAVIAIVGLVAYALSRRKGR